MPKSQPKLSNLTAEQRGEQALNLKNNLAFQDALNGLRAMYTDKLIETSIDDLVTITCFHNKIHALNEIEQALTLFINSGTIEKVQTVKLEKAKNATRDKRPRTS